jgi:predicted transcriptional regulator
MKKVIDWFKHFWFIWFFLLLFYVILRVSGYDFKIVGREVERTEEQNTLEQRRKLLSDNPELVQMGFTLEVLGDPAKFTEAILKMQRENHGQINADITDDEIYNYIRTELGGETPSELRRKSDKSVEIYVDGQTIPIAVVYKITTDGKITIK